MTHPAFVPGAVATITGGASGIGLAAARRLASLGLTICIADRGADRLDAAVAAINAAGDVPVMAVEIDVSRPDDLRALEAEVTAAFGGTDILMNNAGIGPGSTVLGPDENWQRVIDTNLWGVIRGTQIFLPGMLARGRPGLVVNTGSKQGITTPPAIRPTTPPRPA